MAGFLQTAGIASQASDAFDEQRQERRIRSQHEQMNQSQLDENQLYREIVRMAYEHEAAKEAAKEAALAKAKAPVRGAPAGAAPTGLPVAPNAPIAPTVPGTGVSPFEGPPPMPAAIQTMPPAVPEYANGGPITAEKFTGIYDDQKVGKRLPTIFHEAMQDWQQPGYAHGLNLEPTVHELIGHANSYADGGSISPSSDPSATPDEDQKKFLDTLLTTGVASPPDVNAVVPGIKVTSDPTNLPGRLVNSQDPAVNLVSQSGKATNRNKGDAANPDPSGSAGGPDSSPGSSPAGPGSVAPTAANVAMTAALFAVNPVAAISHLVNTTLVNNNPFAAATTTNEPTMPPATPMANFTNDEAPTSTTVDPNAPMPAAVAMANFTDDTAPPDTSPTPADPASDPSAPSDAGDAGSSGGDAGDFKGGGLLWNHFKSKMAPALTKKARPAAVKFKKNGGALKSSKGGPGGKVKGPGTGTSDSVPASLKTPGGSTQGINLSNGEYVLSADTVRAIGKDKLDALQARYHKQVR